MSDAFEPDRDTETEGGTEAQHAALADLFGLDTDPLAEFSPALVTADIDPFEMFVKDVLDARGLTSKTRGHYRRAFRQWVAFMADDEQHPEPDRGRHPACPNTGHVLRFIRYNLDVRGIKPTTVKKKLQLLNAAYEWWQIKQSFPHPTTFNPFKEAREGVNLKTPGPKEPPYIPVEVLRQILAGVTHVRTRAILFSQLKLGIRVSELCNIKIKDFDIQNSELREHYPDMGTNPKLDGYENAIYIPPRNERRGNKSERPRVLPLDDETRRVLLRYLLVRPDAGEPWLFLSVKNHAHLKEKGVQALWRDTFREPYPEYDGTDRNRPVTSHYGRHYFTTWWENKGTPRERVNYMRGDKPGASTDGSVKGRGSINRYIHIQYEHIEEMYRDEIYRLAVPGSPGV